MHVSSPSDTHRKIPRTRIPRNRTTPATTRTNLRPAPMTEKRVPSRRAISLIPAKEDPSRAATEMVALDLAKEEKVVDPSRMAMVLLEIMARVVLESSEWWLVFIMFVACWSGYCIQIFHIISQNIIRSPIITSQSIWIQQVHPKQIRQRLWKGTVKGTLLALLHIPKLPL